jgi:mannose-1-phosphate guanylyltransferase / mannose-6-phosphate isomerase
MSNVITPVIMCGGVGSRLWPVSRESLPKQFITLVGSRSTFQQTLLRVQCGTLFSKPIVVTHSDFRFIVAEQVQELGLEVDIALEPCRRDSALAVAVASEIAQRRDPTNNVLILSADHVVRNEDAFHAACADASRLANDGRIVTFGIVSTCPATSFGYIRPGTKMHGAEAFAIEAFSEKPDASHAKQLVADGCLWNSGNFVFRPEVMLNEMRRLQPAIANAARDAVDGATEDLDFRRLAEQAFARAPKLSVDYAVMEHTSLGVVLAVDFGWSDIGSWDAVWDIRERDDNGNATEGAAEVFDTHNSLVLSDGSSLIAVLGCRDIIVVSTVDATLVTTRDRVADVKPLVERLRMRNRREAIEHRRMLRPWGHYQGVDSGNRYQVKRIVVKPGASLSLQKHFHRAEHWVVVRGTAEVSVDETVKIVHENESAYIPIGSTHRLMNPGKIPLELIEVQVGSYLGEDDIVRLDDVYHRA